MLNETASKIETEMTSQKSSSKANQNQMISFECQTKSQRLPLLEEDALELLSNWNLSTALVLLDIEGFEFKTENIADRLNISRLEANNIIDNLERIGAIAKDSTGSYKANPLHFYSDDFKSSDILDLYKKSSSKAEEKINSRDIFSYRLEALSLSSIHKYLPEIKSIIEKIIIDSKGKDDCEVYYNSLSFVKISKKRGNLK